MGIFGIKNKQTEILDKIQRNLDKSEENILTIATMLEQISGNKETVDTSVIEKIKENLDNSQIVSEALFEKIENNSQPNVAELALLVNQITENQTSKKISIKSEADQLKAAYALNLCTVSVSQIIDYNDIYFLEREYEAILNNLNLEQMPKDEALLDILKKLLDVITYFRIQEGDKKMLEKKYQHEMKNAIWNAVPNLGLIVAGGNPVTMAISLASQVGIGYMNYRKTKAENELKREEKEWELQRSAMEQFNALRRELFTTAWRLAEEYNFPEEYRLTERQITQYNEILIDPDYLRRYERLEYIQKKFKAYPPYWYYLGNAANMISQDDSFPENLRDEYKDKACAHFETFINKTGKGLLREDHVLAAAALELFDIIPWDNSNEQQLAYKKQLLEKAVEASGNAYDVLQLCAMSYLKINEIDEAANILKMLVNSEYNTIMNAQLLSRLYVTEYLNNSEKREYYKLKYASLINSSNIDPCYLMSIPEKLPESKEEKEKTEKDFFDNQLANFKEKFKLICITFTNKYMRDFSHLTKAEDILLFFSDMYQCLCELPYTNNKICDEFYNKLRKTIVEKRDCFDRDNTTNLRFTEIARPALPDFIGAVSQEINDKLKTLSELSIADTQLSKFCDKCKISEPIIKSNDNRITKNQIKDRTFKLNLVLNKEEAKKIEIEKKVKDILDNFDVSSLIKNKNENIHFYKDGESEFYKRLDSLNNIEDLKVLAILETKKKFRRKKTIAFGVRDIYYEFVWYPYEYLSLGKETQGKIEMGIYEYDNDDIYIDKLWELIQKLKECSKN